MQYFHLQQAGNAALTCAQSRGWVTSPQTLELERLRSPPKPSADVLPQAADSVDVSNAPEADTGLATALDLCSFVPSAVHKREVTGSCLRSLLAYLQLLTGLCWPQRLQESFLPGEAD